VNDEAETDPSCQVCGRRLLPGERPTSYVTRDGAQAVVCELCKPRAEAAGWLLPEEAEALGGMGRERRRPRGQMLGGLLARLPTAANGEDTTGEEGARSNPEPRGGARRAPRAPRSARERTRAGAASNEEATVRPQPAPVAAPAKPAAAGGDSSGTTIPEALAAFNASNHRRTVAGLTRTLGPPRASGLAVRAASGYPGARLTVAWELTWYQWEVGPGPGGPEVRESGKGDTIDQLRAADRTWNLLVDSDGTLEQRSVSRAPRAPDSP